MAKTGSHQLDFATPQMALLPRDDKALTSATALDLLIYNTMLGTRCEGAISCSMMQKEATAGDALLAHLVGICAG